MEGSFYKHNDALNYDPNLTFEQNRDMLAEAMKHYAFRSKSLL
jgi:hypothetical protein